MVLSGTLSHMYIWLKPFQHQAQYLSDTVAVHEGTDAFLTEET